MLSKYDLWKWSRFSLWHQIKKILYLESHLPATLILHPNCFPSTHRKFCVISVANCWTHTIFLKIHHVVLYTLEILGEILKMIHFCRFLCISFFWTLQIAFVVHNTTHGSYIKVTIFICGWCQAICSKLKCQMREFPLCFLNIPNFWPVVYLRPAWVVNKYGPEVWAVLCSAVLSHTGGENGASSAISVRALLKL